MPNYGSLTPEIIRDRLRQEEERFRDRKRALEARINAIKARAKSVDELKKWMDRRKLSLSDVFWILTQLRPKRADTPVKSKKPLHPDVRAMRGPTAHTGGLGARKMPMVGDPAFMQAIRKARLEKNWDYQTVGPKVGVSGASVANWETGRYTPKEETRVKILKLYGLPLGLGAEATKAAIARAAGGKKPNGLATSR